MIFTIYVRVLTDRQTVRGLSSGIELRGICRPQVPSLELDASCTLHVNARSERPS